MAYLSTRQSIFDDFISFHFHDWFAVDIIKHRVDRRRLRKFPQIIIQDTIQKTFMKKTRYLLLHSVKYLSNWFMHTRYTSIQFNSESDFFFFHQINTRKNDICHLNIQSSSSDLHGPGELSKFLVLIKTGFAIGRLVRSDKKSTNSRANIH